MIPWLLLSAALVWLGMFWLPRMLAAEWTARRDEWRQRLVADAPRSVWWRYRAAQAWTVMEALLLFAIGTTYIVLALLRVFG